MLSAMQAWEPCAVYVILFIEGSGGAPRELLHVKPFRRRVTSGRDIPRANAASNLRRVWVALIAVAALRAAWLAVAFLYGAGDVLRHHVESAAFILAGFLVVSAIWYARPSKASAAQRPTLPLAFAAGCRDRRSRAVLPGAPRRPAV